ncbi:MAG: lysine exporter LysO family protein [Bacteroidales bacterium]|nr:lysine exporter LysO family protein [Bacteroidales bacterium]MCM1146551.1 lysine exporter LysO family protein [Bacteroidales bacterium]MCM1205943.1 lysine exporter LysO family protein [Bacillota bacterium]MCM1510179.1 lysine exporter LysO family protein [Clostridium sp.]
MFIVFGYLFSGIIIGRLFFRNHENSRLPKVISWIVRLLLLSLGLEAGSDSMIMGSLGTLGLTALLMTVAAMSGSSLLASCLWLGVRKSGGSTLPCLGMPSEGTAPAAENDRHDGMRNRPGILWDSMKDSFAVVMFFLSGIILGLSGIMPSDIRPVSLTNYVLYALLLCVGMTIGVDSGFFSRMKGLDRKLMLLPLTTACGTFLGVAVLWAFSRQYLLTDCLAVGSGFAYYSLSSVFITEMRGAELGTVALLSNIFREILAMLVIPLTARALNPLAAVSMGGATTFDTSLPVIMQSAGKDYLIVAAFHGLTLDFSVPLFVTLFCSINS